MARFKLAIAGNNPATYFCFDLSTGTAVAVAVFGVTFVIPCFFVVFAGAGALVVVTTGAGSTLETVELGAAFATGATFTGSCFGAGFALFPSCATAAVENNPMQANNINFFIF